MMGEVIVMAEVNQAYGTVAYKEEIKKLYAQDMKKNQHDKVALERQRQIYCDLFTLFANKHGVRPSDSTDNKALYKLLELVRVVAS